MTPLMWIDFVSGIYSDQSWGRSLFFFWVKALSNGHEYGIRGTTFHQKSWTSSDKIDRYSTLWRFNIYLINQSRNFRSLLKLWIHHQLTSPSIWLHFQQTIHLIQVQNPLSKPDRAYRCNRSARTVLQTEFRNHHYFKLEFGLPDSS